MMNSQSGETLASILKKSYVYLGRTVNSVKYRNLLFLRCKGEDLGCRMIANFKMGEWVLCCTGWTQSFP